MRGSVKEKEKKKKKWAINNFGLERKKNLILGLH